MLPIDKPPGPSSHDVVAAARRVLRTRRVGHTGTLDPFASGLLILCVGWATRLAEYLVRMPKSYTATARLGEETDTDDRTGTVINRSEAWRSLRREDVAAALGRQVGRQLQVPPAYSAKKVAGERLYQKARRGEQVSAEAVAVEIESIRLTEWDPPLVSFATTCSSGTYIRAIGRNLGAELGTFAHLTALRRTAIGPHGVADAITLEQLLQEGPADRLLDPLIALDHLPRLDVDDAAAAATRHGRPVPAPAELNAPTVLVAWRGRLLAVGASSGGRLQPHKVFDD